LQVTKLFAAAIASAPSPNCEPIEAQVSPARAVYVRTQVVEALWVGAELEEVPLVVPVMVMVEVGAGGMHRFVPAQISPQLTNELAAWIAEPETPNWLPTASQVVLEGVTYMETQVEGRLEAVAVGAEVEVVVVVG
jgi:hypothetical protein